MRATATGFAALMLLLPAAAMAVPSDDPPPDLNTLYQRSARLGAVYENATAQAEDARKSADQEREALSQARESWAEQRAVVAQLTLEQMQSPPGLQHMTDLMRGGGPRELLARAAAYEATNEAMSARMTELDVRATVHQAALSRWKQAVADQSAAAEKSETARTAINRAIAEAKRVTAAAVPPAVPKLTAVPAPLPSVVPTAVPTVVPTVVPPKPPKSGDVDPNDDAVWDKIAKCESGGRWNINTGNGYYGGLQFSERTWKGIGGPGMPHEQTREVQIFYAKKLQARYGWGQWSCAGARFK